jgi:hypothetical protein
LPKQRLAKPGFMVDRIAQALAEADGETVDADPGRYRRLAIASLGPLVVPTEAMIDAAHEAVQFDAAWAINSRRDFRRAVRAMITRAMDEGHEADER